LHSPPPSAELTREELERRQHDLSVIHDFAVSLLEQTTLSDLTWGITKCAIARLDFEECIVYLRDFARDVMVQAAAHGPKRSPTDSVVDPLEIPVGFGVVGTAAATGAVQLVADTRREPRYIVDDAQRLSELAVPIVHGGEVIGVLDSEHTEANHFREEHVRILRTVASMAAPRIVALEAEQRLARQTRDLREARDVAEAASRTKSRFVASMSHELRTPLAAIIGFADQLRGELADQVTAEQCELIDTVRRSGRHLMALVNDILDLSKLDAGQLQVDSRPVDICLLVSEVCQMLRPQASQRGLGVAVKFAPKLPDRVATDPTRLRQILVNVIGNAIKHCPTGRADVTVAVDAENLASGRCRLVITVTDHGDGMSCGTLARVFRAFERGVDSESGVGLGLPISRYLARLLDGDVTATSVAGKGSVFRVQIDAPVVERLEPPADAEPTTTVPAANRRAGRVLVVDDSLEMRRLMERFLGMHRFDITTVTDGEQAVAEWHNDSEYHLIMMDMRMPVLDGYSATRRLRESGCKVPIIALTAHAMAGDEQKCRDAGCSAYLTKPFNLQHLLREVERWIAAS